MYVVVTDITLCTLFSPGRSDTRGVPMHGAGVHVEVTCRLSPWLVGGLGGGRVPMDGAPVLYRFRFFVTLRSSPSEIVIPGWMSAVFPLVAKLN